MGCIRNTYTNIYAMHYPAMEYATDSPEAERTLEKVALELGLIDKI